MSTKIYVGNLSWNTTDDSLRATFSEYGQVLDSIVMRDRDTGRSRGFGFVTYGSAGEANSAINALHETELDGRRIKVNMANARPQGGYGGGGSGGFSGNNNNYQGGGGYGGGGGYPNQAPNMAAYSGYNVPGYGAPPPQAQYGNNQGYPQGGYGGGQY